MKPTKVITESKLEREMRLDRAAESDQLLKLAERAVERSEKGYWDDTRRMLGWYEAMRDRMGSAPAIDYSNERVQGITVDRDERIHCIAYVEMALRHLEERQGDDRGRALLWLHFRVPRALPGQFYEDRDGLKRQKYSEPGVAIRDLYLHMDGRSKHATDRAFWRAFRIVEAFALQKGWVRYPVLRKGEEQRQQVYQRDRSEG